jgi:hypothetical protein
MVMTRRRRWRRARTFKVIDRGDVPEVGVDARVQLIPFDCVCGVEAELPVLGRVIAMTGCGIPGQLPGVVFDPGPQAMPRHIQCRRCRRRFTTEVE